MAQVTQIQFAAVDRARAALKQYEEATGEALNVDPALMVESVAKERFTLSATERPFLENMMDQAQLLAQFVGQSDWTILVGPTTSSFITSDAAFVSVPPRDRDLTATGSGYELPGVIHYFSLTERMCLELRHGYSGYRYQHVDRRYMRAVNRNIAANSDRFVIGRADRHLETPVKDCGLIKWTIPVASRLT